MVAATTRRLPNRRHQRPLNGIDSSDPIPGASRTSPSSATLAPSRSLVAGSLATQAASRNPFTAKTSAVASAARRSRGSVAARRAEGSRWPAGVVPRSIGITRST